MTDSTSHLTPEQEHAFYADPVNQEPQGPGVRRRSKLSSTVPVRFSEDVLQQLRDRAAHDDRSVSQWIRRAVERELARPNACPPILDRHCWRLGPHRRRAFGVRGTTLRS